MFSNMNKLSVGCVALLGLPSDEGSSFKRGAAKAPGFIRQMFHQGSSNLCAENGLDLSCEPRFQDMGDLDLAEDMRGRVTTAVTTLLEAGAHVLSLGGDHAVTFPIMQAIAKVMGPVNILHFDAHPDLYDELDGNPFSHACPFARIMEAGLAKRLIQVGIRTLNDHQREQIARFGVEVFEARHWSPEVDLKLDGPLYISLDLDALDPAFAPGVSHQEPGGLSTRDILKVIQKIRVPIVGADVVELNPTLDVGNQTATVGFKFVKELAARIIETNPLEGACH